MTIAIGIMLLALALVFGALAILIMTKSKSYVGSLGVAIPAIGVCLALVLAGSVFLTV